MDKLGSSFNQKNTVDGQANEKSSQPPSSDRTPPTVSGKTDGPSTTPLLAASSTSATSTNASSASKVRTTAPAYNAPSTPAVGHQASGAWNSVAPTTTASSANAFTSISSSSTSSTNSSSSGVIFNHQHQFMAAVAKGSVGSINHYLSEFKDLVDIDAIDPATGKSALRTAIEAGDDKTAAFLVNEGAQLKAITKMHETPLMLAAKNGLTATVRAMIENGAKIDKSFKTSGGKTALHFAVQAGQAKTVRELLELGAKANLKDGLGNTAIFYACKEGKSDVLEAFFIREGFDDSQLKTKHIESMLLVACSGANDQAALETVKTLFQFGGSATCLQEKTGNSMLHIAVQHGHLNTATYLLEKTDAEPNAANFNGETAAFFVNGRNAAMVQLLNAYGIVKGKLY